MSMWQVEVKSRDGTRWLFISSELSEHDAREYAEECAEDNTGETYRVVEIVKRVVWESIPA